MKVAHVTATFPPYWAGTGNVAYHNARLLHERGHEVTVLTARTPHDHQLSFPYRVDRMPTPIRLGNAPLTPHLVPRLSGFDLIHVHYPYIFGAESAVIAARLYGTPLVVTYHNRLQETHPLKRILFGAYNLTVEPVVMRSAVRLLAVRAQHLFSLFPALEGSSKVVEVPNGVDVELFTPQPVAEARRQFDLARDVPIALFVGALDQAHRFKNVDGILHAFADVARRDAILVIVGDGTLRPGLELLAHRLGLGTRVRFLGALKPENLPAIYSAADVTVLFSSAVESFGIVLIESMACGTPIIVSDLPGVRALVDQGVDGRLVPPGDRRCLTQALDAALGDRAASAAMGAVGCAKIRTHYTWDVIGDRLAHVYEEVLAA